MTPVGYLLDEHTPTYWAAEAQREEPSIEIMRVGTSGAPPYGTPDQDLLLFCEAAKLILVTCDRRSMYTHIANHLAGGGVFQGMLAIGRSVTTEQIVNDLVLIHAIHHAEDFIDTVMTLPL
ncbi:MAG TPA: hypothetical protein VGL71_01160 [Urbifossiella sp.]